tara:strand:- start:5673 stop:6137 length:465 start_codon:yes stop_codon:yes gene_type:complete
VVNRNNSKAQDPKTVAMNQHPSCLTDFVGAWQLSRQILQQRGETFSFEGQANFNWSASELIYHESGVVTAPDGRELQAQRSYFWQQTGGKLAVLFDDKRFFHSFSAADPNAQHLCGDDHYVVNYNFDHWPLWESRWQVTGPRKDYKMISVYRRS